MACSLVGVKPLSEPTLEYCQFEPWEKISVKFEVKFIIFIQENILENVVCEMAAILSWPQCVKRSFGIFMLWWHIILELFQSMSHWNDPLTHYGLVMKQIWVTIGSGNGLLPDGTKPLPDPMLIYHHWSPAVCIHLMAISLEMVKIAIIRICCKITHFKLRSSSRVLW